MPSISNHQSAKTTKLLLLGDSSSGKTGALASLAQAGYNLRIIDVDNGLDILRNYLVSGSYGPEAASRVEYETITDKMKIMGGKLIPVQATVWQRSIALLDSWKTSSADFGNISTWTPQDVLVIDTLSFLADGALKFIMAMNARLGQQAHQSDWFHAQQLIEGLLQKLYDDSVVCNVVVNCHVKYIEGENGLPTKGFPESVGKALSPKIGRYFNSTLLAKTVGKEHKLLTQSTPMIELKTTNPLTVKPEYPIATGLADYFRDVRAGGK